MTRALKAQLKSLRSVGANPRHEWVATTRSTLLAQIQNSALPRRTSFAKTLWQAARIFDMPSLLMRPMAAVLVVAVSVGSWVATSKASQEALPGDTLYTVKIATEKTQLAWVAMMNDKTKTAQMHVTLAGRRADEAKKIVSSVPGKKIRVSETVNTIRQELVAANENLHEIKQSSAAALSPEVVSAIKQQTDDIKKSLQEVKITLQTSTTTADKILSEQVTEVKNVAKDTDVATVQVAVADHLKTNSALTKDYVNALIDATLTRAVKEAGEASGNFSEVTTVVVEAARDLTTAHALATPSSTVIATGTTTSTAAVSTSSPSVSSSPITSSTVLETSSTISASLKQAIAAVADETTVAAAKTQSTTVQISQKVSEAKQILSSGDLTLAAAKIQEITDAFKEVEKITDATIMKVQVGLPDAVSLSSVSTSSVTSTGQLKEKIDSILRSVVTSTMVTTSEPLSSSVKNDVVSTLPDTTSTVSTTQISVSTTATGSPKK